jgi:hypothetical protein
VSLAHHALNPSPSLISTETLSFPRPLIRISCFSAPPQQGCELPPNRRSCRHHGGNLRTSGWSPPTPLLPLPSHPLVSLRILRLLRRLRAAVPTSPSDRIPVAATSTSYWSDQTTPAAVPPTFALPTRA